MVSFKKTADVSVEITSKGYRQDTAACVSLSRSTISKTQEPEDRPHRLAPGCGGGGDVVASVFRVKRLFRRRTSFRRPRPEAREAGVYRLIFLRQAVLFEEEPFSAGPARKPGRRVFTAPFLRVKWFFLKKNLSLRNRPGGRRRRLSKEDRSPCQPGFSAILRSGRSRPSRPQKTAE